MMLLNCMHGSTELDVIGSILNFPDIASVVVYCGSLRHIAGIVEASHQDPDQDPQHACEFMTKHHR